MQLSFEKKKEEKKLNFLGGLPSSLKSVCEINIHELVTQAYDYDSKRNDSAQVGI